MKVLKNKDGEIINTPHYAPKTVASEPILSGKIDMAEMKRDVKRPTRDIEVCLAATKSLFEYLDGLGGVDKIENAFQLLGRHYRFKYVPIPEKVEQPDGVLEAMKKMEKLLAKGPVC